VSTLRYRSIGTTDLRASEIGFAMAAATAGAATGPGRPGTGSAPGPVGRPRSDEDVVALVWRALDLGITFFDTADVDGEDGRGERLLGRAVRGRRDEVTIATKFGWDVDPPRPPGAPRVPGQDWSAAYAGRALDRSLRRLALEPIDLWQLHHPGMDAIGSDELFGFLDEQVTKGKIRAYGVALGPGPGWADEGVAALRDRRVAAVQTVFSLAAPDPGRELAQVAAETEAGLLARLASAPALVGGVPIPAPAAAGGTGGPAAQARPQRRPGAGDAPAGGPAAGAGSLERFDFLTRDRGLTMGQADCRYVLGHPAVATVLPDIDDEERLVEYATASDLPDLPAEDLDRIAELHEARR
jgi:aryl-alcohol dehydrogenase-like predicted oxidoreductase